MFSYEYYAYVSPFVCFVQALKLLKKSSSPQEEPPALPGSLPRTHRPAQRRVLRIQLPGRRRGGGGWIKEGEGEEEEEEEDDIRELEERIGKVGLPEHAMKAAQKELKV